LVESKAELVSLQQIRCFCAAIELGSFSAAAEALRVSQPAVAEQIRNLEQILGTDLFVRAARGVMPTEAGEAFAVHTTRSLQALDDAAASVSQFTSLQSGTVALGTFSAPSAWRLEALVESFLERHPDVAVRLVGRNSSVIADRVRRGELEAAVVLLPIDDERLDVRPIVRDEVLYVTAAPERARHPASIEQLVSAPLVFYDAESADEDPIRRQLAERAQAHGARLRPRVEVELIDMALRLVARGLGDTYLPSAYTYAPYFPKGLRTVPFSPALYDTFALITRPAARLSPSVRELLAELETHMRAVADEFDRQRGVGRVLRAGARPERSLGPGAGSAQTAPAFAAEAVAVARVGDAGVGCRRSAALRTSSSASSKNSSRGSRTPAATAALSCSS